MWAAAQRTGGPQARSNWPEWLSRGFSDIAVQWQNQNIGKWFISVAVLHIYIYIHIHTHTDTYIYICDIFVP